MSEAKNKTFFSNVEYRSRRYRFAKASLAIEGQHLTREEQTVFRTIVREGCTLEQMDALLERQFPVDRHEPIRR